MGTRWLEASSAEEAVGLRSDVMRMSAREPRGRQSPQGPCPVVSNDLIWSPPLNKSLSPYSFEHVKWILKPVLGIQEDYQGNECPTFEARDVLNSTVNLFCELGLVIILFWTHNPCDSAVFK